MLAEREAGMGRGLECVADGGVMVACYLSVLNGRKLGSNIVEMKPHSQEAEGDGLYIFVCLLWGRCVGRGLEGREPEPASPERKGKDHNTCV